MIATIAWGCSALAFGAFGVLAVLTHRSHARFLARLRELHPAVWTQLQDAPVGPDDPPPTVLSESSRYVTTRGYLKLPEPELHRLGERSRKIGASLPYVFVAGFVFACVAVGLGEWAGG